MLFNKDTCTHAHTHTHTHAHTHKQTESKQTEDALTQNPVNIIEIREYAKSKEGFYNIKIRKEVWPRLVGVDISKIRPYEGLPHVDDEVREQVELDVNRCGIRIPAGK